MNEAVKAIFNHLPADAKQKCMSEKTKNYFDHIFRTYHNIQIEGERQQIGDELETLKFGELLLKYMNIVTDFCNQFPLEGDNYENYKVLIEIAWDVSDCSEKFCRQICELGIVSFLVKILKQFQGDFTKPKSKYFSVHSAVSVLHNCSRRGDNRTYFHEEKDLIDVLAWYVKNSPKNSEITVVSALILAEIMDDKYSGVIVADEYIIKKIIELLELSLEAKNHRVHGFSSSELIVGITRLANSGKHSQVIVKNGVLNSIQKMLKVGNETEMLDAAEAVGVLAFFDSVKDVILADEEIVGLLTKISSTPTTSKNSRLLKRAAEGALWVARKFPISYSAKMPQPAIFADVELLQATVQKETIKEGSVVDDAISLKDVPLNKPVGHIMISYQWSYQDLMKKIAQKLERDGYKVWIDVESMEGSILEAMAEAVEGANLILLSMGRKYKDSFNCRTEAEYAFNLRKEVIPLKVEKSYRADGWLGAILGTKLYYDFTDTQNFEQVYKELKKAIGDVGKSDNKTTVPDTPTSKNSGSEVDTWKNTDVENWLKHNNIQKKVAEPINGKILLFLKQMKRDAPEFYFRCITEKLGLENLEDMMNFTSALAKL